MELRNVQIVLLLPFFHVMMMQSISLMPQKRKVQSRMLVMQCVLNGMEVFLLVDGSKSPFYQCLGLHGDAWFDKDGMYSINCQVHYYQCVYLDSDTDISTTILVGYHASQLDDC